MLVIAMLVTTIMALVALLTTTAIALGILFILRLCSVSFVGAQTITSEPTGNDYYDDNDV